MTTSGVNSPLRIKIMSPYCFCNLVNSENGSPGFLVDKTAKLPSNRLLGYGPIIFKQMRQSGDSSFEIQTPKLEELK